MTGFRLPGRFAWKMLLALLAVAFVAVGTATYTLWYALRATATLTTEHRRELGTASTNAAEVLRAYFADRKEEFRRRTLDLAASAPAAVAPLAGMAGLLRARLTDGERVIDEWSAPRESAARMREAPPLRAPLPDSAGGPRRVLELTFGIPTDTYETYLELQRAIDREAQLEQAYDAMVPRFFRRYFVLIFCILGVAPIVGLLFARRVTGRVARLSEAARRVGAGDLTVKVAPAGKDELDELGRSFDRMVAELAEARARLEYLQKVSAWQEVARRLAHEIKNPLTPVQLAVQELASRYSGQDVAYRRLLETAREILHEEITGLRRMVDDFSAFAKLPEVSPAPVDLAALVAEAVRLQPEWHQHVQVAQAIGSVPASCDRTLFRRVLANLVNNAFEAARGAGREPAVRIAVEHRGERAAVLVDDNGPGVAPADRQRIFDPYVTFRAGGTGLGLAIVRKIVIDHGGDVSVDPAASLLGGARFVIELPSA